MMDIEFASLSSDFFQHLFFFLAGLFSGFCFKQPSKGDSE